MKLAMAHPPAIKVAVANTRCRMPAPQVADGVGLHCAKRLATVIARRNYRYVRFVRHSTGDQRGVEFVSITDVQVPDPNRSRSTPVARGAVEARQSGRPPVAALAAAIAFRRYRFAGSGVQSIHGAASPDSVIPCRALANHWASPTRRPQPSARHAKQCGQCRMAGTAKACHPQRR